LTTLNYASKYGIASGSKFDFVIGGRLGSGANFISRSAPAFGSNLGGAPEIVVNPNSVILDYFYMPD